jgi:hypothetical protein
MFLFCEHFSALKTLKGCVKIRPIFSPGLCEGKMSDDFCRNGFFLHISVLIFEKVYSLCINHNKYTNPPLIIKTYDKTILQGRKNR